ncbi:MAG TPA: phytanoyl-CoA dioxygenase family protein [Acidimicrobiia bacterium]|nr:phytanoyl-CoA dioxygenase family protein [Acidimicrobiia bacterium]
MTTPDRAPRRSVDTRTRGAGWAPEVDPATFWAEAWCDAIARNGDRAAADADRLELAPLAIAVDDEAWTLRTGAGGIEVVRGRDAELEVGIDRSAFAELVSEQRTALGLVIGARVTGDPAANELFCAWDPVLRSVIDGRGVYRPGDVTLQATDGSPLDLDRKFRLGEGRADAAHFLAEAGFLLLTGVFSDAEMDAVNSDFDRAVASARPDDGESWWAATRNGDRYPCRILNFTRKSETLRGLIADSRFDAIGEILGDGHRPGDPFGEHFDDVTAEGLSKQVGSVEGLACLPWHKDCDRGGHSMFCCGLTIGICLTPVDAAHGGLDVTAGSHRANIARAQIDRGLDLPNVTLTAERGDLTVHLSCTLHRSTHPTSRERRVAYTGFTLPPRPDDRRASAGETQERLERERAAIGDPSRRARLGPLA